MTFFNIKRRKKKSMLPIIKGLKSFPKMILLLMTIVGCSQHIPPKIYLSPLPKLRPVEVRNCHTINGKKFCEVEIEPLAKNDAELKAYILKLRKSPAFLPR